MTVEVMTKEGQDFVFMAATIAGLLREWSDDPDNVNVSSWLLNAVPSLIASIEVAAIADTHSWTPEKHHRDTELVKQAMQKIAQRSVRGTVHVPSEDASDLLMELHQLGIYASERREDA